MIDIEQYDGSLKISYFDEQGQVCIDKFDIPSDEMFEWEYCKDGEKSFPGVLSWDGKPVRRRRARFLSKWRIEEFLSGLPTERTKNIYAPNTPKKFFVDIETEVISGEWPKPETAKFAVTAISFCTGDKVIAMGIKPLNSEQIQKIGKRLKEYLKEDIEFNYLYFKTEYDMLYSFFYKAIQKMPLLTGWNFIGFDWTYLINRCKRLNIDIAVASPTMKLNGDLEMPAHKMIVDYLDVYKKWDRVIDIKENNTLDFVAKAALGIEKVKYPGTLQELYENDFDTYIFYNAVDAKLVEMIDRKLNTLQTFLTLGNIVKVEATRAYSPIWMAEAAMSREFLLRRRVFPRMDNTKKKREKYEGAFVVDPQTGLYEWVTSFDFASLYPSIMRQWNISPESYLRNVLDKSEVDFENEILCSSGAVFRKNEDSVFRSILTDYYAQRKVSKNTYEEIEQEIDMFKQYIKN